VLNPSSLSGALFGPSPRDRPACAASDTLTIVPGLAANILYAARAVSTAVSCSTDVHTPGRLAPSSGRQRASAAASPTAVKDLYPVHSQLWRPIPSPSPLASRCVALLPSPLPACAALGRLHIASPCHTILPPRSVPRHIRPRHPTFRNPAWRIPTFSQDSSSPWAIPLLTRIPRPRCSPHTPIRRPKGSRAMSPTEGRRRVPTCRCRRSTYHQYVCKMDSNHRRPNNSQCSNPWALHFLHRHMECRSTTGTRHIPMRRKASR